MIRDFSTGLVTLALIIFLGALMLSCSPRSGADLVLYNGTILTMDRYLPPAGAMAIVDGKVLAVGRKDEIMSQATMGTKRIDLKGAIVVPGLTDSHMHLLSFGRSLDQLNLMGTSSPEEIADLVRARAKELPAGSWIPGRGWDQNDWQVQQFPTHDILDQAAPDHPVMLHRVDGHAAWLNGKALELAGISASTQEPDGGSIVRANDGQPTGILIDNAMELVSSVLDDPTPKDIRRWLLAAIEQCNRAGLTAVHDACVDQATLDVIWQLVKEGKFSIRFYGMLDGSDDALLDLYLRADPVVNYGGRITLRAVKFFADGALGSRGAALLSDYSDDPGNRGLILTPPDQLRELIGRTIDAGYQPAVHAIGDRANRMMLDIYEALATGENTDVRPRIEHAQVLARKDIARFGKLGVIASMQPSHATSDMYWAEDRLGARRVKGAYAWRSLLEKGATICAGSDCPVEKIDPLLQIYAARTRQDTLGWPSGGWYREERLGGLEALKAMTTWSAFAAFQENYRGKL
ncbi:MAG: amidohydrolase, partial [Candidatus Marinimicrobia bacterium]|nr:amidohydrolase [Candidatus Neomarinimicrobiota bacterium]